MTEEHVKFLAELVKKQHPRVLGVKRLVEHRLSASPQCAWVNRIT